MLLDARGFFNGASCGSRTRVPGLEDRCSSVELRTPVDRGGARDGVPPPAHPPRVMFPARLSKRLLGARPGGPDGDDPRQQKNPAPLRARGSGRSFFDLVYGAPPRPVRFIRIGQAIRHRPLRKAGRRRFGIRDHQPLHARFNRAGGRRFAGFGRDDHFSEGTGTRARKPTRKMTNTVARPREGTSQMDRHWGTPPTV
jgi:hypothetical protein